MFADRFKTCHCCSGKALHLTRFVGGRYMRSWLSKIALALCLTFAAGVFAATVVPADAMADKKAKKDAAKPSIEDILGDLKWGMSHAKVQEILADKINQDYLAKVKGSTDESYADTMRKSYADRADNMRKSYMPLMRDNVASLSVSIIGEEFMPDNNESIITQREDIATKYYFFLNDKLYKIAVVYDSNYLGPIAFDSFVATAEAKYGKSNDEVWDDDANFLEAIWKKNATKLSVKNKYLSYGTCLMVFSEEAVENTVNKSHKAYYDSMNSGPEVSSDIDALTADVEEDYSGSVNKILGKDTKVDLLAGLSEEDRAVAEGRITEKEVEKQKKAKAKKEKASRKRNDAKVKQGLEIF